MDSEILKILNEELIESKKQTHLAQQRLDIQREELNNHSKMLSDHNDMLKRHQSGFEILFKNLQKMEERFDLQIKQLKEN